MANIQDLSSALTEKYGLSAEDARLFVGQMFGLVADELHSSQSSVKIKGLGTFKVSSVSSRESVDVNTGERIVLSGRNKISFTPDVVMRDRVNRPFAQFETVVLNEGVDFSEIDNCNTGETDGAASTESNAPETVKPEIAAAEEAEPVARDEHSVDEQLAQTAEKDTVTPMPPTDEAEEEQPVDAEEHEETPDSFSSCEAEECGVKYAKPQPDNQSSETLHHLDEADDDKLPGGFFHIKCMKFCCLSAIAAVVLCSFCFGFYYMYDLLQQRNRRIETLEKEITQVVAANKKANEALVRLDSASTIAAALPLSGDDKTTAADSISTEKPHSANNDSGLDIDYESDPRLRTGAYIIIGVDRTVVVRKGQTLESISKAYLGSGMECYVEALNRCKSVAPGDSLKIPKLKWKKHRK